MKYWNAVSRLLASIAMWSIVIFLIIFALAIVFLMVWGTWLVADSILHSCISVVVTIVAWLTICSIAWGFVLKVMDSCNGG